MLLAGLSAASTDCLDTKTIVEGTLNERTQSSQVVEYQLREYLMDRVTPLPAKPNDPKRWLEVADTLRQQVLENIIFHGWRKDWIESSLNITEDVLVENIVDNDDKYNGFQIRRLSFEIIPKFSTSAILYIPKKKKRNCSPCCL